MPNTLDHQLLQIDPRDNCAVALQDLAPGAFTYKDQPLAVVHQGRAKHKLLLEDLPEGAEVMMYGVTVGQTTEDLPRGAWLTTKNLHHQTEQPVVRDRNYAWFPPDTSRFAGRTFEGYHRPDGRVGTANYWLFVPLVFCENRNLREIEHALQVSLGYRPESPYLNFAKSLVKGDVSESAVAKRHFENIDGVRFLYHDGGCGGTRQDSESLLRLLAGYVHHPNVAGATVLSLGCQHAQIDWFKEVQQALYPQSEKPILYFEQQQIADEDTLIRQAIQQSLEAMEEANQQGRQPAPLSKLALGLECGASDGFSGITANPSVGQASDLLVALGGSSILAEFPELNGVEQNIIDRSVSVQVAQKFMDLQTAYASAATAVGSGFDMNPSPGNIKEGLITDAMKSAGAAKKGGTAPVSDVLDYTEPLRQAGLNLLCTPGNDVESTTGLAASGAQIILFTTGLGTPTGNPLAQTVKISSNSEVFHRMGSIIDLDAGALVSGQKTLEQMGEEILDFVIAVASGQKSTKAMDLYQHDFIPWKRGVSL